VQSGESRTGNVAASASPTASRNAATAWVRQLTRSAQALDGRMPTTRVPGLGPLPSAAAVSVTPAKSQPGRHPVSACCTARPVSPRLSEIAVTRTVTSSRSGSRSSTGLIANFPGAAGSTTTARTCQGMPFSCQTRIYSDARCRPSARRDALVMTLGAFSAPRILRLSPTTIAAPSVS
jgi:hypothetical protein